MDRPEHYISRQVRVEALQWTGDNLRAVQAFCWPTSPFYAPAVVTSDLVTSREARLQVQIRDEVADERYPALAPQFKTIDVPMGAWLVRRVHEHPVAELVVLTGKRFYATFAELADLVLPARAAMREPAADDQGATIDVWRRDER